MNIKNHIKILKQAKKFLVKEHIKGFNNIGICGSIYSSPAYIEDKNSWNDIYPSPYDDLQKYFHEPLYFLYGEYLWELNSSGFKNRINLINNEIKYLKSQISIWSRFKKLIKI